MSKYFIEPISLNFCEESNLVDIIFSADEICRTNNPDFDLLTFCYAYHLLSEYEESGQKIRICIINSIKLVESSDSKINEMARKAIKVLEILCDKKLLSDNTDQESEHITSSNECDFLKDELWIGNEAGRDRLFKLDKIVYDIKELREHIDFIYEHDTPESLENMRKLRSVMEQLDFVIEELGSTQDDMCNLYYGE